MTIGSLDSPAAQDLVDTRDPVDALADAAGGFRWRLQTEDGTATAIPGFGDEQGDEVGVIANAPTAWREQGAARRVHLPGPRRRRPDRRL